jgi:hypothetical protein
VHHFIKLLSASFCQEKNDSAVGFVSVMDEPLLIASENVQAGVKFS